MNLEDRPIGGWARKGEKTSPGQWLYAVRSGVTGLGASGLIIVACSAFVVGAGTFVPPATRGERAQVREFGDSPIARGNGSSHPRGSVASAAHGKASSRVHDRQAPPATEKGWAAGRRTRPVAVGPIAPTNHGSQPARGSSPSARQDRHEAAPSDPVPATTAAIAAPPAVARSSPVPPLPVLPPSSPARPPPPISPTSVVEPALPAPPAATALAVPTVP